MSGTVQDSLKAYVAFGKPNAGCRRRHSTNSNGAKQRPARPASIRNQQGSIRFSSRPPKAFFWVRPLARSPRIACARVDEVLITGSDCAKALSGSGFSRRVVHRLATTRNRLRPCEANGDSPRRLWATFAGQKVSQWRTIRAQKSSKEASVFTSHYVGLSL